MIGVLSLVYSPDEVVRTQRTLDGGRKTEINLMNSIAWT